MKVVFSYDCEGNWGSVDHPGALLPDSAAPALQDVYKRLIDLHETYAIPATFAFVGLYALPAADRSDYVQTHLSDLTASTPNLLKTDGCWNGSTNLKLVQSAVNANPNLEIGSHSLTHLPHHQLTPAQAQREFLNSAEILRNAGANPAAFIYPRNKISYADTCLQTYASYRNTPALTLMQRGSEIARAVTGLRLAEAGQISDFVFYKGGHRRHFSDQGWMRLWQRRLASAGQSNDTIHVWSHPHNAVTDPQVLPRIEWLMQQLKASQTHLSFHRLSHITPMGALA